MFVQISVILVENCRSYGEFSFSPPSWISPPKSEIKGEKKNMGLFIFRVLQHIKNSIQSEGDTKLMSLVSTIN